MSSQPVAVDLFSGAGGLSLGFQRAGFNIVAWVEKDPYASQTLRTNHLKGACAIEPVICQPIESVPYVEVNARMEQVGAKGADVLIGGPPCKGYSRSNKRTRTLENPLNSLYVHFLAFARQLKPRIVVMENVGDILLFAGGAVVAHIRNELASMGYLVQVETLNASRYGVPQVRNRTIIVAHQRGMQFVYPEGKATEPLTVWDAISDLPNVSNGNTEDELPYASRPVTQYQASMRNGHSLVSNNLVTRNSELVLERYAHIPQGGNWRNIPDHLMHNYADKQRCHQWIYRRLPENSPSVTITNFRKNMLIHPREDRGLSVREAARLQSFPDSYRFTGGILHQQQQVADAVPPLLAEAVAVEVMKALNGR